MNLAEKWEALLGLPAAFADAPLFFSVIFAVGGLAIWWKWKVIGNSQRRAMEGVTHGLRAAADSKQLRHETGIGTRDVMIMRQAPLGGVIWFALLFFGGGAVFYVLVVLQSGETTSEDWWVFAGLAGFTIGAMAVIENNQTRIQVDDTSLQKRRVLHRRQTIPFSEIVSVQPHGKSYVGGVVITPATGAPMRIPAAFSGYRDLLPRLAPHDPKLQLMTKLFASQQGRQNA